MAIQDDNTILKKSDLKAYHEAIASMLGGSFMMSTNVSDYYSEDEKIVGVWTDGKPIYQKTIDVGVLPNTSTKNITAGISNIDKLVNMFGTMNNDTTGYAIPQFNTGLEWLLTLSYRKTTDSITIMTTKDYSIYSGYVTLQYTKTTDTVNSALTTPGCYDINFPNTWPENKEIFFGGGLYGTRKTGTITAAADERVWTAIVTTSGNLPSIINSGGWIKWGDEGTHDYKYSINSTLTGLTGWGSTLGAWSVIRTGDTQIALWNISGLPRTNAPYDVWVTYTK